MTPPQFPERDWTVPPPDPPPQRPIHGRKVAAGIGLAVLGQVVVIGIGIGLLAVFSNSNDINNSLIGVYVEIGLQVLLFLACVVVGIVWIVQRDRGLGLGLLIGWAVTVLVFPLAGLGICVALFNNSSGGL